MQCFPKRTYGRIPMKPAFFGSGSQANFGACLLHFSSKMAPRFESTESSHLSCPLRTIRSTVALAARSASRVQSIDGFSGGGAAIAAGGGPPGISTSCCERGCFLWDSPGCVLGAPGIGAWGKSSNCNACGFCTFHSLVPERSERIFGSSASARTCAATTATKTAQRSGEIRELEYKVAPVRRQ